MMHDWKSKVLRKRTRFSRTPGRQKVLSCQATIMDRTFSKRNRSYKLPGYAAWANVIKEGNSKVAIRR